MGTLSTETSSAPTVALAAGALDKPSEEKETDRGLSARLSGKEDNNTNIPPPPPPPPEAPVESETIDGENDVECASQVGQSLMQPEETSSELRPAPTETVTPE